MSRRLTATALTGTALALTMIVTALPAYATEDAKPTRLKNYQVRFQPVPGPEGDKYKYRTTTKYWSVVATSPTSTADTELRLYGDRKEDELLGTSFLGAGATDFVAVDSNHRELDTYFPRVDTASGSGTYDIQLAQGSDSLGVPTQEIDMTDNEIVAVRDTYLVAGETYRFTLTPGSALMDGDLFLMDSLPLTPDTWVKSRSMSLDSGFAPAGSPVVMELVAPRSDWYGVVIVREGVFGTYDLTRSLR